MSDDLIRDQFARLLDGLPADDPWPAIGRSGFLDLLVPARAGGAGLPLEEFLPLVLDVGERLEHLDIIPAIALRGLGAGDVELARAMEALAATENGFVVAAAMTAGLMTGAMRRILALSVEYATTRRQFGKPIARFQAVQAQLAVMAEQLTAAEAAVTLCFVGEVADMSLAAAAVAKLRAGEAAREVAPLAHAVHGAIGVSEEYPLHRYVAQLAEWRRCCGTERYWSMKLGELVLQASSDILSIARACQRMPAAADPR